MLHRNSISELGRLLRNREVSARELALSALDDIASNDVRIGAFITVTPERALSDADRADRMFSQGIDLGALQGIPYGLKDMIDTAGIRTTYGSGLHVGHTPVKDSAIAMALARAGGVLIGKLATNEFAYAGPCDDLPFKPTRNPHNLDHFTGGSSTGSAAAVAAGFLRLAIGTDTGGSVRGPAAWCGVTGLMPGAELLDLTGVKQLAPTLDRLGALTLTAQDAALFLTKLTGGETSVGLNAIGTSLRRLRVGTIWPAGSSCNPDISNAFLMAMERLRHCGAEIDSAKVPDFSEFGACGRIIFASEAFATHSEQARANLDGFARMNADRMILGASLSASDYIAALSLRRRLTSAVNKAFDEFDLLATLTVTATAPSFSDMGPGFTVLGPSSPMKTIAFNVTGHPAISIPFGASEDGLPIGIQFAASNGNERLLLAVGSYLESISSARFN